MASQQQRTWCFFYTAPAIPGPASRYFYPLVYYSILPCDKYLVFSKVFRIRWKHEFRASRIRIHNYLYGSGDYFQQAKKKKTNIYFCSFVTLSLKSDVHVLQQVISKNVRKKTKSLGILKATKEKSRIRIRNPVVRIPGSKFVTKFKMSLMVIFSLGACGLFERLHFF